MPSKTLAVLIIIAIFGIGSNAMAKGGGGAAIMGSSASNLGSKGGSPRGRFGHSHFGHSRIGNRFHQNQILLGGWGWDWPYGESGYTNNTVVVAPRFPAADLTGSVGSPTPCHWNSETFSVPSSSGGNRPVEVVNCQ